MVSVSAIQSASSRELETVRHSTTSALLARVDERSLCFLARRCEALVVAARSLVAPETVRVAAPGSGVVQADEARIGVLPLALDDPRHQLPVQLVACEAEHLVHLLEHDDLPEGEGELVVEVVAAEPRRLLQATAEPDELRPVREQRAHA